MYAWEKEGARKCITYLYVHIHMSYTPRTHDLRFAFSEREREGATGATATASQCSQRYGVERTRLGLLLIGIALGKC